MDLETHKDGSKISSANFGQAKSSASPGQVSAPGLGRIRLLAQKYFDLVFFAFFPGLIFFTQRYILKIRVKNISETRRFYHELLKDKTPLLICSNHLTYIDSVILVQAFASTWSYIGNFRTLPWNLPASNYRSNPFFRLVGIFSKCLFIDRDGTREQKQAVLSSARWLMAQGDPVMIFPEGRRSKTGRFDDGHIAYGIGKILSGLPECRVLCCYLRADGQSGPSKMPASGSNFELTYKVIHFDAERLRQDDVVASTLNEIVVCVKNLEDAYFKVHGSPTPSA